MRSISAGVSSTSTSTSTRNTSAATPPVQYHDTHNVPVAENEVKSELTHGETDASTRKVYDPETVINSLFACCSWGSFTSLRLPYGARLFLFRLAYGAHLSPCLWLSNMCHSTSIDTNLSILKKQL
jgi:hypothetical protein